MMRLKDKVAIVTGGASGIGEATVRLFVQEGAKVTIADMNEEKGEALAKELGDSTNFVKTNVTNESEVENMVNKTVETFGKLDILFNNAGIGDLHPTDELSFEHWQRTISVNLDGVFLVAKHAIRAMKKNGSGSIVNTASILGHVGDAQVASYAASKGAVANLTRALAVEFAQDNIRVNAVCPGYVITPLIDQLDEEAREYLVTQHPIGRLGKPEEIAKAVLFLASDDASFVTGANLLVDGGYTAR